MSQGQNVGLPDMSSPEVVRPVVGRRGRIWRWVVLLLALGMAAFVAGVVHGVRGEPGLVVPSPAQQSVLNESGAPPLWLLVESGDDPVPFRYEQWFYPDNGGIVTFLDGSLHGALEVTWSDDAVFSVTSPISPIELDRTMTPSDVDDAVGSVGLEREPANSELGLMSTRSYPEAHLIVQFLDGHLYTAQTS